MSDPMKPISQETAKVLTDKHTPGPWAVDYLDKAGQRVVRAEHFEVCTCWHHCVGSIEKEMEANARLIAAAPALYEALEEVRNYQGGADSALEDPYVMERVDAALSLARMEQDNG